MYRRFSHHNPAARAVGTVDKKDEGQPSPPQGYGYARFFRSNSSPSLPERPLLTSAVAPSPSPRISSSQSSPSLPAALPPTIPSTLLSRPPVGRITKPRRPRKGREIDSNEHRPFVSAADRLRCWTTPFSLEHQASLDLQISAHATHKLNEVLLSSWSDQTRTNYGAGLLRFTQFCDREGISEQDRMPASRVLLAAFAADAAGVNSGSSISGWFSALRAWHTFNGAAWQGDDDLVSQVKQGASKLAPNSARRPLRPPVTIEHLLALSHSLHLTQPFDAAVWVVALCAFWGCCRLGELTVKSANSYDPSRHVSRSAPVTFRQNISPHSSQTKESLHFPIPWTKTTKEAGANLSITGADSSLCPCNAMRNHLSVNGGAPQTSHLFAYHLPDGGWAPMVKTAFMKRCMIIWTHHGLDVAVLGHSFRIGGSTELLLAGVPPEIVAAIGRWKSLAFLLYWRKIEEVLPRAVSRSYEPNRIRNVAAAFEQFRIVQNIPTSCTITHGP